MPTQWLFLLNLLLILAVLLIGQRLLFDGGMLSLCGAGFFAAGGYSSALLALRGHLPPLAAAILTTLGAGALAAALGYPLLRTLRSDFFALATLGLAQAAYVGLRSAAPGGPAGLASVPKFETLLGANLPPVFEALVVNGAAATACLAVAAIIRRSRFGYLSRAAAADENAVCALGQRPLRIKVQVFALAGAMAALSGSLQAHYLGVVEPRMASIQMVVLILIGTLLSGSRNVAGALFGAAFLVLLPELLQRVLSTEFGPRWQVFPVVNLLAGAVVVVVALAGGRHRGASWGDRRHHD